TTALLATAEVALRLLGVPFWRPPVLIPGAILFLGLFGLTLLTYLSNSTLELWRVQIMQKSRPLGLVQTIARPSRFDGSVRLPCGCRLCGCCCVVHCRPEMVDSGPVPSGLGRLCAVHACEAVLGTIAREASALISLALFVGMIAVWAAVL